ncbi:MAG TPA: FRG domain-containing protein [bacterium]|nr:FRG domain-containing protein [bacterium]
MPNRPRWVESPVIDGIKNYELIGWHTYGKLVEQYLNLSAYVWRGQRCDDWKLVPTLDREIPKVAFGRRGNVAENHLGAFRYATRGRRGPNPPELGENDMWALGQHHGLATPLLDWTSSPFAAAFFAFMNEGRPQTPRRAVYALHRTAVELRSAQIRTEHTRANTPGRAPVVEFVTPLSNDNPRLVSQGGLFTRAPSGIDIESWVRSSFKGQSDAYCIKITVPDGNRHDCLRSLNRMNINHVTLFPDLYGAAKFCNTSLVVDNY